MPRRTVNTPFDSSPSRFGVAASNPGFEDRFLDNAVRNVQQMFVAVEVQVPPDFAPLPEGKDYALYLSGAERPDWSRREALRLAEAMLRFRAWVQAHLDQATELGVSRPVRMAQWHGVSRCPRCNELQIIESGASNKMQLCQVCVAQCTESHRGNAYTCDNCRSQVQILWRSDEPIPEEWHG